MLNFKEFLQEQDTANAAFLPTAWTGSETGTDMDKKSPIGSVDMAMKGVEKTGSIVNVEFNTNPIEIRISDGSNILISHDHIRSFLGEGDWRSKLEIGRTIIVKYDTDTENARISGITIH